MAFSNLIGSILFLALGIWAWFQTDGFPEVANTYVQASTFPRIMIVGMLIFAAVLFVQSILKLMGTLKDTDPLAVQVSTLNPLKDKGVAMAYVVIVLCVLFAALFKSCGYLACAFVLSMAIMYIIGKRQVAADGAGVPAGAAGHVAHLLQSSDRQHPAGSAEFPADPCGP